MNEQDFYYLGKILRTHGNKGQLIVHLDVDEPESYKKLESVYLDVYGERIPFFIASIEIRERNTALFLFTDFQTTEEASELAGKEIYLPVSALPELSGNQFYFHEIEGFEAIDAVHGNIGIVDTVLELPRQALLQIKKDGKEILVPLVDEVIQKVDRENRKLFLEVPEGLIEIYL